MTKYEQETTINYNQEEAIAVCCTMDKKLIRKLDRLCEKSQTCIRVSAQNGICTYTFPKKWIRVQIPKQYSEEQRREMALRAKERFHKEVHSIEKN